MKNLFKANTIYNLLFNEDLPKIDTSTCEKYGLSQHDLYNNLINTKWAEKLYDKLFLDVDIRLMFTEYIKSTLKSKNIKITSLAKMIGISRTHLSGVLNLKYNLTIDMAKTFCDLLDLNMHEYDLLILYYKSKKTIETILKK